MCVSVCVGFGGLQEHFTSLHTSIIMTFGIMRTCPHNSIKIHLFEPQEQPPASFVNVLLSV